MKRLLVLIAILAAALAGVQARTATPVPQTRSKHPDSTADKLQKALPLLREGDVIFIRIDNVLFNPLFRRITETSQSWESHVGILFRDSAGRWTVAQSAFPFATFKSLDRFVRHSEDSRFLVRRLRTGLTPQETQRLRAASESRMGRSYELGFQYDSRRLYCSKFVYDAYLEATGRTIGRLETFRELLEGNPDAPVGFWRAWFFGRIPWDRRCVTTTSQLQSPAMITVFDSEKPPR